MAARPSLRSQRSFYGDYVEQLVREDKKAVVIISDALRYEVAEELRLPHPPGGPLRRRPRGRPRRAAELHPTRHGGAASAPHARSTRPTARPCSPTTSRPTAPRSASKDPGDRRADGDPGRGLQGPEADERRELFKNNRVLYIYHDVIDATGDKPGTERRVFEAAELALTRVGGPGEEGRERQRHQHLRHRRPRLPVPGRRAARAVLPLRDAQGDKHPRHQQALRARPRPEGRRRLHHVHRGAARARQRHRGPDPQVDPPAPARRRRHTLRPRRRDPPGDRRAGARGQQEAQERHPPGQRQGSARHRQDHHRPARREAVPVRARQRQGAGAQCCARGCTSARR